MSELGDALRAARKAKGMSQTELAGHFGVTKAAVYMWERGRNIPDPRKITALAATLELDLALVVRLAGIPAPGASPLPGRPGIPVWASAGAGSDGADSDDVASNGAMVLARDPIDWIRRSERLQGVTSAFAFYVIGSSMSPAIEHGDQVVVNPSLLPAAGKDHVFLQTREDGTMLALVKRLLRIGASSWTVRQFNPTKDFDLPKGKWAKAMMVTEKRVG